MRPPTSCETKCRSLGRDEIGCLGLPFREDLSSSHMPKLCISGLDSKLQYFGCVLENTCIFLSSKMADVYTDEFTGWWRHHPTTVRSVFALHLAEAIFPPFDTLRCVLDVWCCCDPYAYRLTLSEEQVAEVSEVFGLFGNGDVISTQRLGTIMRSIGDNPTDAELGDMIAMADPEGRGTITLIAFLNIMSRRMICSDPGDDCIEACKIFDKDGSGFITAVDLRHVLENLGEKLTSDEIDEMIRDVSTDPIQYVDFFTMIMSK